ncbi:MAG TPA: hypothetical protein VGZ02_17325 [Candidatus Baltobacteraceae bacterium]|jgi:hypothetical protein|nr:hypothetical protein [Candidatus Baltobacteraceae bacterium]
MTSSRLRILAFVVAFAIGSAGSLDVSPSAFAASTGGHDFDFLLGTFQTHISYLQASKGSSKWVALTGIVTNRKIWDGAGDLEEIEANGPSGPLEGMTLRIYNAQTREWSLYWADSSDGMLQVPSIGRFSGNIGTFYDQELVNGRTAFVRQRYFNTGPNSYRFEQAVSIDGGKTWRPNFVASLIRTATPPSYAGAGSSPMQHSFDWQFGTWRIRMSRLLHPLSGAPARDELNGSVVVNKIWNGRANVAKIDAQGRSGSLHILALRLYSPQSAQWSLSFTTEGAGTLSVPMYGTFKGGVGEFYDQEFYHGKAILDRFRFISLSASSARDEEAFSQDGGRTWETNWIDLHTRVSGTASLSRGVRER